MYDRTHERVQGAGTDWHDEPGNAEEVDSMDTFVIEGGHRPYLVGSALTASKNADAPDSRGLGF